MINEILTGNSPVIVDFIKSMGLDPGSTYRVVIDITVNEPVRIYVQQYLGSMSLDVILPSLPQAIIIKTDGDSA